MYVSRKKKGVKVNTRQGQRVSRAKRTNSGLVVGAEDVVDKALDDAGLARTDLAHNEDLIPELLLHTVVRLCPCETEKKKEKDRDTCEEAQKQKKRGRKGHKP